MRRIENSLIKLSAHFSDELHDKLHQFATVTSTVSPDSKRDIHSIAIDANKMPLLQSFLIDLYGLSKLDIDVEKDKVFDSLSEASCNILPAGVNSNVLLQKIDCSETGSAATPNSLRLDKFLNEKQKTLRNSLRLCELDAAKDSNKIDKIKSQIQDLNKDIHLLRDFYQLAGAPGFHNPETQSKLLFVYDLVVDYKPETKKTLQQNANKSIKPNSAKSSVKSKAISKNSKTKPHSKKLSVVEPKTQNGYHPLADIDLNIKDAVSKGIAAIQNKVKSKCYRAGKQK